MIVYGDPQFSQSWPEAVARLRERASHLKRSTTNLDDSRELLVRAGQLEQAVHDALPSQLVPDEAQHWIERCQRCTDLAAAAFFAHWQQTQNEQLPGKASPNEASPNDGAKWLQLLVQELESVLPLDFELNVKLPEGFAFYTLFSEGYAVSALRWMNEHAPEKSRKIGVIGIRSIGTSLSALMKVALQSNGWDAHRWTVRPTGHPFARETRLDKKELNGAEWFLVVDEGPGLSGSSMASVAQALHDLGVAPQRIVFFPGHRGEPGEQASSSIRFWWNTTARYVTPLEELHWNGQSLSQMLANRTRELLDTESLDTELLNAGEQVARIEDLSGGLWRAIKYSNLDLWPPVAPQFERTKLRVTLNDGRAVLWKFVGFVSLCERSATEEMQRELHRRAANDCTLAPLGSCCGFVATPWIEGRSLSREDKTPELLSHIGNYIVDCRGAPMTPAEAQISHGRLTEMLICNARQALGEEAGQRAQFWSEKAQADELAPTYGDGHLAPHEWIRTSEGRVLKTDCWGHSWDHTVAGRQSWLWDLAGAIVEWDLDNETAAPLLCAISAVKAQAVSRDQLRFHCLSYAAFRLGMLAMSAQNASQQRAVAFYRQALQRALEDDFEYSTS